MTQARRTGAWAPLAHPVFRWEFYRDGAAEDRFVEEFRVPSWDEHLRQHGGRLTGFDREIQARVDALTTAPPEVDHLFPTGEPGGRSPGLGPAPDPDAATAG